MNIIKTFLILSFFFPVLTNAADRHVGPAQSYTTIQSAINDAGSGDTIIVHGGTYREEVRIHVDNITICANGSDTVIINGCEPLLNWTDEGNGVYSTIMDWDITEGDQTNQLFVDGKMIFFARWPDQTSDDIVMTPTLATMDGVEEIDYNTGEITDFDFEDEDTTRWEGAMIYINLSNPECKKDGQGWTGPIEDIVNGKIRTKAGGARRYKTCGNWHIGIGSRYFLFNPTPSAVEASGGVSALLSNGEWWKHNDTLFIKMPDGGAPASSLGESNLVEAKKYPYAFRPESNGTFSNVTIKGLNMFATSITTDDDYYSRLSVAPASNNVFDDLNVKYVTHSYDCSGNWQMQWNGRSGIIVAGTNNVLKNSTIVYSNASGASLIGKGNKLLNCFLKNMNYNVTESAAMNFGMRNAISVDHIIAYNTIYNTPHSGISIRNFNEEDSEVTRGQARIHHNLLYDCLSRVYDAGIIDGSGDKNGLRIDHNIMYNAPEWLQIGIYLDYGEYVNNSLHIADLIADHNIIHNVWTPVMVNACSYLNICNNTLKRTGSLDVWGIYLEDKRVYIQNNIGDSDDFGENPFINHNIPMDTALNNNYFNFSDSLDYTLTPQAIRAIDSGVVTSYDDPVSGNAPDIGAYEYGQPGWNAGAIDSSITFYQLEITTVNGKVIPGNGLYKKSEKISVKAPDVLGYTFDHWSGDFNGSDNPKIISMDSSITAVAHFVPISTYTLTTHVTNGNVSLYPDDGEYNVGTLVKIVATPESFKYKFIGWTGDTVVNDINPLFITMNESMDVTANIVLKDSFTLETHTVNGRIRVSPENSKYIEGTEVNIFAIPDEGYTFDKWTGDTNIIDTLFRQDIVMNHNMSITAHFVTDMVSVSNEFYHPGPKIYPNPNKGDYINIEMKRKVNKTVNVRIINLFGSKLYEEDFYSNSFIVPLSDIHAVKKGCYLIEINVGDICFRRKLFIN